MGFCSLFPVSVCGVLTVLVLHCRINEKILGKFGESEELMLGLFKLVFWDGLDGKLMLLRGLANCFGGFFSFGGRFLFRAGSFLEGCPVVTRFFGTAWA